MCLPKSASGLNVTDIVLWNNAIICKQNPKAKDFLEQAGICFDELTTI